MSRPQHMYSYDASTYRFVHESGRITATHGSGASGDYDDNNYAVTLWIDGTRLWLPFFSDYLNDQHIEILKNEVGQGFRAILRLSPFIIDKHNLIRFSRMEAAFESFSKIHTDLKREDTVEKMIEHIVAILNCRIGFRTPIITIVDAISSREEMSDIFFKIYRDHIRKTGA